MYNKTVIKKAKEILVAEGIIAETEDIYTKGVWRTKGYRVNKEATPVTTIPIYIYAPHDIYDEKGIFVKTAKMLGVNASFYTISQVTEIKKGA